MPVVSSNHGGRCCGVFHLTGFTVYCDGNRTNTEARLKTEIKAAMARFLSGANNNRVAEVCINKSQATANGGLVPRVLREMGFTLVQRFKNSNSYNEVFIFHKIVKPLSIDPADLPFVWGPPIKPVATFRRIGSTGRATPSVFETLADAQAGRGPTIRKIVKIVEGKPSEIVWSLEPQVKNPFGAFGNGD